MKALPDLLNPAMTDAAKVGYWWAGELDWKARRRRERSAGAHLYGAHVNRPSTDCETCQVAHGRLAAFAARLLTETFAFGPPPIPRGFSR